MWMYLPRLKLLCSISHDLEVCLVSRFLYSWYANKAQNPMLWIKIVKQRMYPKLSITHLNVPTFRDVKKYEDDTSRKWTSNIYACTQNAHAIYLNILKSTTLHFLWVQIYCFKEDITFTPFSIFIYTDVFTFWGK